MASFFSKASSFLSSQAEQQTPSHGGKGDNEEETHKPASSGGYGDLLAGAQSLMNSAKPSDHEGESRKAPASSGGYGDLLESAQSFMATSKPSAGGEKEGDTHKAPSSGGYGDLLASAQAMMGSAKLSGDEDKKEAAAKTTSSGDSSYGDMYASAQVLMGAAKASRDGAAADMGEVAGAAANLIGGATRYGNLEKTTYGDYAQKAQTYLQDYQASHGKASHKPSSPEEASPPESKPQKTPLKLEEENDEERGSSTPPVKNPMTKSSEEEYN